MTENRRYQLIVSKYEDEQYVAVHEAFTDDLGNINAITDYPVTIDGDSVEEIKGKLAMINHDINKFAPILDRDIDNVLSINDPELVPLDEIDIDEYEDYAVDPDEDLVDIFNKRR